MRAYFLVRDSVALARAHIAAIQRKDLPELIGWLTRSPEPAYCVLDDEEFERVKSYSGAIVLTSDVMGGKEIAIAFEPREEWPDEFTAFRRYFDEVEKRMEDRENITEEIWFGCDDRPFDLANYALPELSSRKVRLLAIACCELVTDRMVDERSRRAVTVARGHAEGTATHEDLAAAEREADEALMSFRRRNSLEQSPEFAAAALAANAAAALERTPTEDSPDGWMSLCCAGWTVSDFLISHTIHASDGDPDIQAKITGLLRDICGNPFHSVSLDARRLPHGVFSLARTIYDELAFDRLTELADALEQSGCMEKSALSHCRSPGPHVRGCWVLDLMLGKDPAGLHLGG
jgi:hypothetical protein